MEEPAEEAPIPIGRIEYLHTDGRVREQIEYTDVVQMEKDLREDVYKRQGRQHPYRKDL